MLIYRNIRGIIADILIPYYSSAGNAEYIAENKLIQKTPTWDQLKPPKITDFMDN